LRRYLLHIITINLLLIGCNTATKTLVIEATDANLALQNGVLFYYEMPFTGVLETHNDNVVLIATITYVAGKKHGRETQWYGNGDLLLERFYANGFKTGIHKSWWPSGDLKFEYHFNNKGEFDGVVKEWYKSGQLFRDFNYNSGKEVGHQRMWKTDGTLKANYKVVDGERYGVIGLKKCYTVTVGKDEI